MAGYVSFAAKRELCREQARGWSSCHATLALTIDMKVSALTGADFETLSYIEHN